jgi:subtilisin family serine protease
MRSLALSLLFVISAATACSVEGSSHERVLQHGLLAAFAAQDEVDVIVSFDDPLPSKLLVDRDGHRAGIAGIRQTLLEASRRGFYPTRQFAHIPAVAGRMSRAALEVLSRHPAVSFIQMDSKGQGALTVSVPAIGGDVAKRDYHVTGKGVRVAVLDSGIGSTHPDLKSSVFATQHCFTRGACPPSNTSEGTSAEDDNGHGSHVSGIITSDGVLAGAGFAPDAEIVAVKINDRNSSGYAADWAAGLDWVFTNLSSFNVKLVNASIGTDQLYNSATDCDRSEPALAKAVDNLVRAGVTIFAAAGNRGSTTQVSAPACNTGTIAVGATYKSSQGRQPTSGTYASQLGNEFGDCADDTTAFDQVACFSNSGPRVDMLAPGAVIVSDILQGKTGMYRGTSQASPTAAGVAALMLECNPRLTPAQIKDILVRTGVSVQDPKNGASFPSIRAAAAVKEACGSQADAGTDDANGRDATGAGDLRDAGADRAGSEGVVRTDASLGTGGIGGASGSGAGGGSGSGGVAGASGVGGSSNAGGSGGTAVGGAAGRTGGTVGSGGSGSGGSAGTIASGGASAGSGFGSGGRVGSGGNASGGLGSTAASGGAGGRSGGGSGGSAPSTGSGSGVSGCQCRLEAHLHPSRQLAMVIAMALVGLGAIRRRRP